VETTTDHVRSLQVVRDGGDSGSLPCLVCLRAGEQSSREEVTRLDVGIPQTHEEHTGLETPLPLCFDCHRRRVPQNRTGICFDPDDSVSWGKHDMIPRFGFFRRPCKFFVL